MNLRFFRQIIQPELIEKLLKKFLSVYKKSSTEHKKQLLQLLFNKITLIRKDKSRVINEIELKFDFTEVNTSKTFILIHFYIVKQIMNIPFQYPLPIKN